MVTWPNFFSQLFNGLALGALLALISSGLTIIYGTLGVLNLAHGAMFMLGGYAGYMAYEATGSFIAAVVAMTERGVALAPMRAAALAAARRATWPEVLERFEARLEDTVHAPEAPSARVPAVA